MAQISSMWRMDLCELSLIASQRTQRDVTGVCISMQMEGSHRAVQTDRAHQGFIRLLTMIKRVIVQKRKKEKKKYAH